MTPQIHKLLLSAAIAAAALCGCEKELNLDRYRNPEIENMLVVNSILNPDSLAAVSVTHPFFFSDSHVSFCPVEDLEVRMEIGGEEETLLFDSRTQLYLSRRRPQAGQEIRLNISDSRQQAVACDTMPRKVDIENIEISGEGPIHIYWDNDYRFTYKITFSDTPGEENYYFLAIDYDKDFKFEFSTMGEVDYTVDYVFQVLAGMINQDINGWQPDGVFGYPFCDKGIDGERYTLTVNEIVQTPMTDYMSKLPREVKLYAISKSYFEYMLSVLAMDYDESALRGSLLALGLVEPDAIYSNVGGGTGLLGSYNLSTVKVDLLKHTGGWPEK